MDIPKMPFVPGEGVASHDPLPVPDLKARAMCHGGTSHTRPQSTATWRTGLKAHFEGHELL